MRIGSGVRRKTFSKDTKEKFELFPCQMCVTEYKLIKCEILKKNYDSEKIIELMRAKITENAR
jgi:hypothetical protein